MLIYHKEEIGEYFWNPPIGEWANKLCMFLVEKIMALSKSKN